MFLLKILIFTLLSLSVDSSKTSLIPKQNIEHQHGHPINLLKIDGIEGLENDFEPLNQLFTHPEVKDRKIAVVSIVGSFRKGKSFFMDYCLRFLYANYKSVNYMNNSLANEENWMGDPETPLSGFSFKSGYVRDTKGIIIWSDIFLYDNTKTGEKVAIAVIDTQGLFDTATTPGDNSRIFALGTLISSTQIVNIDKQIQEDQLQYLQLATDFAKLATKNSVGKPFQNLVFLIRDWNHIFDHELGSEGGEDYIKKVLAVKENDTQLRSLREYINNSFDSIKCILMPSPPLNIQRGVMNGNREYDGRHSEMDEEFRNYLKQTIESVVSKENIQIKKVNGEQMTALRFSKIIKEYLTFFTSDEAPKAESLFEITVTTFMQQLTDDLTEKYGISMYNNINITDADLESNFKLNNKVWEATTITEYFKSNKMGTPEHEENFLNNLTKKIEKKMKIIETEIFTKHDEFMLGKENAAIAARVLDDELKVIHQQLAEINLKSKQLKRKQFAIDKEKYSLQNQVLISKKNSLERHIVNYITRKNMEKAMAENNAKLKKMVNNMNKKNIIRSEFYDIGSNGLKTYFLSKNMRREWTDAKRVCESNGMEFVSLDTATEAANFQAICKSNHNLFDMFTLIGGSTQVSRSNVHWYWVNSNSHIEYGLDFWPGRPDNNYGNQYCLAVEKRESTFRFDDIDCHGSRHVEKFVCQFMSVE